MSSIEYDGNKLIVPADPEIGFIEGDGIGKDITEAAIKVFDAAVEKCFQGEKKILWQELAAGEKSFQENGEYLPADTIKSLKKLRVAIKGPLATPVGGGMRSLNVTLRQELDLFSCVRPIRHFTGVPAPVKSPEKVNMVIFRENTEDLYAGIEWQADSEEAIAAAEFVKDKTGKALPAKCGIGIKPVSEKGSKRLIREALKYALANNYPEVTLVHKGNIMKFTEGAFRNWGYELCSEEFKDSVITLQELKEKFNNEIPAGKVVVKDVIADAMFQEVLLRPEEHSVIATLNLNGDYISDALAAQVGGLGMAPGANMGAGIAIFEATHGTAPAIAGKNIANPGSLILSGAMMLEQLGWTECAKMVEKALEKTIASKKVTSDLFSQMEDAELLGTKEFSEEIIKNL